jgi:hypothetical protein
MASYHRSRQDATLGSSILGAERFLDANEAAQADTTETQMGFGFIEELEQYRKYQPFKAALQLEHAYDNVRLYELGIRHDLRPADVNEALRVLEDLGRIAVTTVGAKSRKGKSFYIACKYHKNSERRIVISLT